MSDEGDNGSGVFWSSKKEIISSRRALDNRSSVKILFRGRKRKRNTGRTGVGVEDN